MANSWRAVACAVLAFAALPGAVAAQQKFAFVDGSVLLRNAPGTAEAQAMLQRESQAFEAEIAKWSDSLKKLQKNYQDAEATLSPPQRTARQAEMQATLEKFTRQSDSLRNLAEARQREVLQPVLDLINRVLQDYRTENAYTAIMDLSQAPVIVAYDKNLEKTDEILLLVKKQPAPKLPPTILKSAAKPPPVPPEPATR